MAAKYKPSEEDRTRVGLMAAAGILQPRIAARMRISEKTLRRHFRAELDSGGDDITTSAVSQLVQQIRGGNLGAICFWLKCRAGWRETERIEHTGADGEPVKIIVEYEDRPAKAAPPTPRAE
jgi:hypothetical protein